jgi:hypothetical protein
MYAGEAAIFQEIHGNNAARPMRCIWHREELTQVIESRFYFTQSLYVTPIDVRRAHVAGVVSEFRNSRLHIWTFALHLAALLITCSNVHAARAIDTMTWHGGWRKKATMMTADNRGQNEPMEPTKP